MDDDTEAAKTPYMEPGDSAAAPWIRPGSAIGGRYEIRARLGAGGMGEVWHALDLKLRVDVALKSLHPKYFADDQLLGLLRQEVRSAREVISPNVCRVYDLVELEGRELLSMEHIDGVTLLSVLRERAPLPLTEARDLALQFLTGLGAVHEAGLVHRDFKPENVMITRSGRVVVMDFGIAQKTEAGGTVAGTPAYMAPEQSRGEAVDARTDLYAVGVVLAEMVSEVGLRDHTSRKSVWEAVHEDPPRIPESPWSPVIRKAVAKDPKDRPDSAQALIRALQEITLRVEGAEEKRPYPGLASFTEEDAEHFFGREPEVEAMVRRLGRAHLLALAGPSGAGKSSFLRAGLVPSIPEGWAHVFSQPGGRPVRSLGEALAAPRPDDPDSILETAKNWREDHGEVLVILDQFEELFTLNSPEVQARFADLVGRLVSEADVRVLVSMRNDFLFHCQEHEPLAPLFSELMPLGPPTGAALHRALVQPALSLGYRFEDDSLVTAMLEEVSRERGALPLLAFAAAGLWERRDPDEGLLTREAYEAIGGVAGALAQHAEATLEAIGREREALVRELFRNLVTAQGTRAILDREELLSVAPERGPAESVLQALVDARLLTSFEVPGAEGAQSSHQIEVIHESLLEAWPRLARWRAQDADSAQLRDQLRQAARLWEERGRPEDLLWTGTSFREFEVWRERYPGGLSATEEAFAAAMVRRTAQQRRRRRTAVAAAFGLLLGALATIGSFWVRAEEARTVEQARRLVALGRLELQSDRTNAVAYALKSLETADTEEGRRFAVEALSGGPVARIAPLDMSIAALAAMSPNGEHYAVTDVAGGDGMQVINRDGRISGRLGNGLIPSFLGDELLLVRRGGVPGGPEPITEQWRVPDLTRLEDLPGGGRRIKVNGRHLHFQRNDGEWSLSDWTPGPDGVVVQPLAPMALRADFNPRLVLGDLYHEGRKRRDVYLGWVSDWTREPRLLGRTEGLIRGAAFSSDGQLLAIAARERTPNDLAEIRVWSTDPSEGSDPLVRVIRVPGSGPVRFQPGTRILASRNEPEVSLWDLDRPGFFSPVTMYRPAVSGTLLFDPPGQWLATANVGSVAFYAVTRPYPRVAEIDAMGGTRHRQLFFEPSGDGVVGAFNSALRRIPIRGTDAQPEVIDRVLAGFPALALRPQSHELVVRRYEAAQAPPGSDGGLLYLFDLESGERRELPAVKFVESGWLHGASSPDGAWFALASGGRWLEKVVHLLNVESGERRRLGPVPARDDDPANFLAVGFLPGGDLVTLESNAIRRWNPSDGTHRVVQEGLWDGGSDGGSDLVVIPGTNRAVLLTALESEETELEIVDLDDGSRRPIRSHGNRLVKVAVGPAGQTLVTAGRDRVIRAGPIDGGEPHLLYGHEAEPLLIAVSPDGREIASTEPGKLWVWPMPTGTPRHRLPHDELVARLRSLTNVRVVEDPEGPNGYSFDLDPFRGWADTPEW